MNSTHRRRFSFLAVAAGLSLVLSGCFVSPGKFTSELVLRNDNSFSFTYDGEILFLGLTQLAKMGAATEEEFAAVCYDFSDEGEGGYSSDASDADPASDDDADTNAEPEDVSSEPSIMPGDPYAFATRECTDEEVAEQRADWESRAADRAEQRRKTAEQSSQIMGGIDPDSPEAAEELARLLLRHRGWESVEPVGEGVFKVRYAIDGTLTHGFAFPALERFAVLEPFVQVILRKDGRVRVDAPAFTTRSDANPLGGMTGGMAGLIGFGTLMGAEESSSDAQLAMSRLEGTFSIVTDGEILANNTDEGPATAAFGKRLSWKIDAQTASAPTALIGLTP